LGVGRNDFYLIVGLGRPCAIGVRQVFVGRPDKGQARDGKKVDLPCLPGVRFGSPAGGKISLDLLEW